jgi:hypothetical protein
MSARRLKNHRRLFIFCGALWLSLMPVSLAQMGSEPEDPRREASPSSAQDTMASLFGRGAQMPVMPQMRGSMALPSFDSSELKIDETMVREHDGEGYAYS